MTELRRAWRSYANKLVALEVSSLTRYYDRMIQYARLPHDDGLLFRLIDCPDKASIVADEALPDMTGEHERRSAVLLNGTLNHSSDIQAVLTEMAEKLGSTSRVIAVVYNPYFRAIFRLANQMGFRRGQPPTTFITSTDLRNIARLSGYQVVRTRNAVYCPFRLAGIGTIINAILPSVPLLRHLSFTVVAILAPIAGRIKQNSLTIVIPVRNEKGNIEPALDALRQLREKLPPLEVIFVEGHSTDDTWEEIHRIVPAYCSYFKVLAFRQEGKGKGDAVRLGFKHATGDVLTILDADLTMPARLLPRFCEAYQQGHGELVNGSRLVYATEHEAMRFLNRLGNIVFAKALSRVLSVRLGDSLCGTKLMARHDYARFTAWRRDFGDFDPFGDFELLFPAAVLGLKVVDVPIRYGARSYGETNINRFRHGWMLLKMMIIGFFKVRLGRVN
jgi:Glycosyl transferase family 2